MEHGAGGRSVKVVFQDHLRLTLVMDRGVGLGVGLGGEFSY